MSLIKKIEESLINFIAVINDKDPHVELIKKQEKFTQVIKDAMAEFRKGKISVEISKALPHVMYHWAVYELPEDIKDIKNIKEIKDNLILFQNTIEHILRPKEIKNS